MPSIQVIVWMDWSYNTTATALLYVLHIDHLYRYEIVNRKHFSVYHVISKFNMGVWYMYQGYFRVWGYFPLIYLY